MKRLVVWLLLFTALLLSSLSAQTAVWTPSNVLMSNISAITPSAVARWGAKNKVYYGFSTYNLDRKGLIVCDTDANGNIIGVPRRYALLPSQTTSLNTMVWSVLVNTRDSKLYLGLASYDVDFTTDLSVYSLDANGEPTGSPTGYSSGNSSAYVEDMVLHPTLDRLYMVGYGNVDVNYYDLTTDGVPTGTPGTISTGNSYAIASVDLNTAGTKIYCGAYPGVLESMTLDANGNKTGSTIVKTTTGIDDYLKIAATNNNVCFRNPNTGNLNYWDLAAANGDPTGNLITTTRAIQVKPCRMDNGNLLLVEPVTFTDAITGTTGIEVGLKVCEYAVTTAGAVGTLQNNTATTIDTYDKVSATSVGASPNPVIASTWNYGPSWGNRFKNVAVRYTINSMTVDGDIGPSYKLKDISATADNLKFAYSSRWGKIYMTNPAANNIRTYNIAADTFASNVSATTVGTIAAVDDNQTTYGRLYYPRTNMRIDYRNLSSAGVPGTVVSNTTDMSSINWIAVNTTQHKVYLVGNGGTAGQVGTTEIYKVPIPTGGPQDAFVCDRLHKLYIVTVYNGNSNLWVQNLTTAGVPTGTPTAYSDGLPTGDGSVLLGGVAVHPTLNKLYLSGYGENSTTTGYVAVHDLDASGVPTGTVNLITARGEYPYTWNVRLKGDGSYLYYTVMGVGGFYGVPLQSGGLPVVGAKHSKWTPATGYTPYQIEVASDNLKVFGGTYPWDLFVFDMQANGQAVPAPTAQFACGVQTTSIPAMKIGTATSWINLNTGLADVGGLLHAPLIFDSQDITAANVKIEFSTNNGTTVHKTSTVDTINNTVTFFAPGYDSTASVAANVIGSVNTYADQLTLYHSHITTPADTVPTSYYVGDTVQFGDGVVAGINTLMDIMKDMGHTAITVSGTCTGAQQIPSQVYSSAISNGLAKFGGKNGELPAYFDYETEFFVPGYQTDWAAATVTEISNSMGCAPSEIGAYVLHDEPIWWNPTRYLEVESEDVRKQIFKDYLYSINTDASWFGLTDWTLSNVHCGRLDDTSTTAKRRLYYWSCRYFAQSFANSAKATSDAMISQTNASLNTLINLNNWPMSWCIPHPNAMYAHPYEDMGPDAVSQHPDWFQLARTNSTTCMFTEDWFPDVSAQEWSFRADMMRCAARNATNGMKFGAYVVGVTTGEMPYGAQYKILSLAGHGAKYFESWMFGPKSFLPDNGYSDATWPCMQSLTDGFDLLGQKQSVLYPGAPRTGTVAIHMSIASQPWDSDGASYYDGYPRYWKQEIYGLHAALIHANYPVDFVDDTDIENGKLATYGYKTLYITGPNLSSTAQAAINTWVNAGGTCVVMPGAARADEYNDATTTLFANLGCTQSTVPRLNSPYTWMYETKETISVLSAYQTPLGAVSANVYGQISPLTVTTGTSMATMTGGSAIVLKTYGSGRYMSYGFWPGNQYWNGADRLNQTSVAIGYDNSLGALITAPSGPNYGNAKKFASSSVALVETSLLENVTSGIGITLLNWSEGPVASTTISVNKLAMPTAILNAVNAAISTGTLVVNSAKCGDLSYTVVGDNINITLPLPNVDILTLTSIDWWQIGWQGTGFEQAGTWADRGYYDYYTSTTINGGSDCIGSTPDVFTNYADSNPMASAWGIIGPGSYTIPDPGALHIAISNPGDTTGAYHPIRTATDSINAWTFSCMFTGYNGSQGDDNYVSMIIEDNVGNTIAEVSISDFELLPVPGQDNPATLQPQLFINGNPAVGVNITDDGSLGSILTFGETIEDAAYPGPGTDTPDVGTSLWDIGKNTLQISLQGTNIVYTVRGVAGSTHTIPIAGLAGDAHRPTTLRIVGAGVANWNILNPVFTQ